MTGLATISKYPCEIRDDENGLKSHMGHGLRTSLSIIGNGKKMSTIILCCCYRQKFAALLDHSVSLRSTHKCCKINTLVNLLLPAGLWHMTCLMIIVRTGSISGPEGQVSSLRSQLEYWNIGMLGLRPACLALRSIVGRGFWSFFLLHHERRVAPDGLRTLHFVSNIPSFHYER